jgi:hypothetical protein
MTQHVEIHEIESIEHFAEYVFDQGWTDGLPVFPPTRRLVEDLLKYTGRDPDEVLGTIFPGDGVATLRNVAANCAMAGCLPQHVPVVLAAVEALVDPVMPITTTQSTGSASILTVVTGGIVRELQFHTREWLFGPNGGRSNAAIGRAVRLILWNIGRAHPGKLVKGTMGHPASWSYCIGEEQEITPWLPMHVDLGISADDSAVTVMKAGEHTQLAVPVNTVGLNECITLLARGIGRLGITTSGGKRAFLFVINPALAQTFDRAGFTREKLKSAIAERAFKYSYDWQNDKNQGRATPFAETESSVRSEREIFVSAITPDEIHIVVGGGEAPQMGHCIAISSRSSAGEPMLTKKIRFPA